MGEKIAFGFLGILLLGMLVLCFWINLYLGLFLLVFSTAIIWWIYGVKKKKVDLAMAEAAKKTGLSFQRHPLKYGTIRGSYKGLETEIGVYTDTGSFGGMGVLLTSLSGKGALASLDIRNFTGIKIKHNLGIQRKEVISDGFPLIVADKDEIYLMLPHVSVDAREIERNLDKLCKVAGNLPKRGERSE